MDHLNFEHKYKIPRISTETKQIFCSKASASKRKRYPLIMHQAGDEFNQVFNFVCQESYMRPHCHPGSNMTEKMHLIEGSFELFLFDEVGSIVKTYIMDQPGQKVQVPPFQWHTYIIRSEIAIIYETMMGKYEPLSWKKMAHWAPEEDTIESKSYLTKLAIHETKNYKSHN